MINSNRLWIIGSVTMMIVMLLAGWFIGVQPFLVAAAADEVARLDIEAQNGAKQAEIARLTKNNENLDSVEKEYRTLQKSIPASTDPAAFIAGLDGLAASTGVQVAGITVSDPQAYTIPQSAVQVPVDPAVPSDGETAAPAPTGPVPLVVATSPLITPDNFVGIAVGVDLKGSYPAVLEFVKGLQSGARLVLVTGFSSTTEAATTDAGPLVTARVDGMIYVLKQQ